MTERLADISAHIDGIAQLGAVVNAMRGIAAARAQQARTQLAAVDLYAGSIAAAIGMVLTAMTPPDGSKRQGGRAAVVVFCAEQGFAGAFSERVLAAAQKDLGSAEIFLIGTRGIMALAERGQAPAWHAPLPSHSPGIPRMADGIADALYRRIATGEIDRLDTVYSVWLPGHPVRIERLCLFPFDFTAFAKPQAGALPLLDMAPSVLIEALTADYMHAQLCRAGLHGFAAENEARMQAMAAAHSQVDRELEQLRARQRAVRQEEITEEVIELAAGETANRGRS